MSDRVTKNDVEAALGRLADILGVGTEYGQPGHLTIDAAYGGWCVHQYIGEHGAVTEPLGPGHVSRRELYEKIHTAIRGLSLAEQTARIIRDARDTPGGY